MSCLSVCACLQCFLPPSSPGPQTFVSYIQCHVKASEMVLIIGTVLSTLLSLLCKCRTILIFFALPSQTVRLLQTTTRVLWRSGRARHQHQPHSGRRQLLAEQAAVMFAPVRHRLVAVQPVQRGRRWMHLLLPLASKARSSPSHDCMRVYLLATCPWSLRDCWVSQPSSSVGGCSPSPRHFML